VSDRDAFREARDHGLKARHETREARAVRKAVAEEIAARLDRIVTNVTGAVEAIKDDADARLASASLRAYEHSASIAREIGSRDPA